MVGQLTDPLYNIRIEFKEEDVLPAYRFALSLDYLQKAVVEPFLNGKAIVLGGRIFDIADIKRLNIKQAEEFQESSSRILRLLGRIFQLQPESRFRNSGIDVTDRFLIFGSPPEPSPKSWSDADHSLAQRYDSVVTNELIQRASRQLYLDGHYSSSVERAFVCLSNAVKDKSGRTAADGAELMRTAFSAKSPILKLNTFQSPSERNEQQGYMDIFAGSMTGIRNPRAHDHQLLDSPDVALELLVLANHLMRKLDSAIKKEPETA